MAVTAKWYGKALLNALSKKIDWMNDDIRVALCTSSYAPDQDAHEFFDVHITGQVANGNGYTTGGVALTGKTLTYDAATNTVKLDANDVSLPDSTFTARYAPIYNNTPSTNKPLLGYVDFGENKNPSAGTFKIEWNAAGIFKATAA